MQLLEERKKGMSVHWEPSSKKAEVYDYRSFQQWQESNRYRELRGKVHANRFDNLRNDLPVMLAEAITDTLKKFCPGRKD